MESDLDSSALNSQQLDDLNSSLNVLLDLLKRDTSEFPPLDLLEEIKQCLECVANLPQLLLDQQKAKFVSLSWPADLRIVLGRLFRTFKIPEEYTLLSYELANCTAQALGAEWLKSDPQFLRLLATLSSGRLRVILDKPAEVNMAQLIACLQLQEYFFACVEDEQEWMGDEDATFVGKHCQEAATYVCSYATECARQVRVQLHMELFLVLYRFICAFLNIGGAQIMDKQVLHTALPVLLDVCKYCLSQRDSATAGYLLSNLPAFSDCAQLPDELLSLLIQYIGLELSANKSKTDKQDPDFLTPLRRIADIVEQLADSRPDASWYTPEALNDLDRLVTNFEHYSKEEHNRMSALVRRLRLQQQPLISL